MTTRSTRRSFSLTSAFADLQALLATRATTNEVEREHHSHGESYHISAMPDIVAFPQTTEEVSAIMKISARYQVPVVPFGAGTSLEGHVNALHGGISIDLRQMNKILSVHVDDSDATVEPGVTRSQLVKALKNTGLTFFVDPGADATLGGMASTGASGTTSVRYGTMRENILGLTAVLADGEVVRTGTRARKSSAGYDLTRLFVGSEGTLGVLTEITLRLHALPEAMSVAICSFDTIHGAVKTVIESIQSGTLVARVELLDDMQIDAVNRYSKINLEVLPTLLFEFHGFNSRDVQEQAETVQSIAAENGGNHFEWKTKLEEMDALWSARHNAYFASRALRPGSKVLTTDICVPISRLADCIVETKTDLTTITFPATIVGHVGDGNFHVLCMIDTNNPAEIDEAKRFSDRLVRRALRMSGTCTGEHGVGSGKIKYLREESPSAANLMRIIKKAIDPDNRLNPGKVIEIG